MIFLVAGPLFWGSNGPNLSKRGLAASILDFHGPTFHFLAAGPNMLSAELESRPCSGKLACFLSWLASLCPPKTGPAQPDFRLLLGPFMCRQRSGSSKKGSCDLASNLLPDTPFPSIFNMLLWKDGQHFYAILSFDCSRQFHICSFISYPVVRLSFFIVFIVPTWRDTI